MKHTQHPLSRTAWCLSASPMMPPLLQQAAQNMPCVYLDLSTGRILHVFPAAHAQPLGMVGSAAGPSLHPAGWHTGVL